jgi:ABC-type amino acid transport substrate-binding protein
MKNGTQLIAAVALALPAGCAAPTRTTSAPGRTLVIATDAAFPPFHYTDEQGHVTGHDVELAIEAARRARYRAEVIVVRPYSALFDGLLSGRHHLVAATTGLTPQRQAAFALSIPYFDTCQAILVRTGPGEPAGLSDLKGRRVGAAGDGTSARALAGLSGVQAVRLDSSSGALAELTAGRIDALVNDEFEAVSAARRQPELLRVLAEQAAPESYVFVMHPANLKLKSQIDEALRDMERDGTMTQLRSRFGLDRPADWPVLQSKLAPP